MAPRTKQLPRMSVPDIITPRRPAVSSKQPRTSGIERAKFGRCDMINKFTEKEDSVSWWEETRNMPSDEEDMEGVEYEHMFFRVANSFSFVKVDQMVAATDLEAGDIDMVAWCGSLSGGARRVTGKLSGHWPHLEDRKDREKKVWKADYGVVRVRVTKLEIVSRQVLDFTKRSVWVEAADGRSTYLLQNPFTPYRPVWEQTRRTYKRSGLDLPVWSDMVLEGPREPWANAWAVSMLRLENGLPARNQQDPPKPNLERLVAQATPGPDVHKAGKGKKVQSNDPNAADDVEGGDEVGFSDASSIERDDEDSVPTGLAWRGGDPNVWRLEQERATHAEEEAQPDPVGELVRVIITLCINTTALAPSGDGPCAPALDVASATGEGLGTVPHQGVGEHTADEDDEAALALLQSTIMHCDDEDLIDVMTPRPLVAPVLAQNSEHTPPSLQMTTLTRASGSPSEAEPNVEHGRGATSAAPAPMVEPPPPSRTTPVRATRRPGVPSVPRSEQTGPD